MLRQTLIGIIGAAFVALLVIAFKPSGEKEYALLSFTNLPSLANGFYYEGWAVIDGEPWSTGRFNVTADGSLVTPEGEATGGEYEASVDLSDATLYAVTVHPANDNRGANAQHIVGGEITDFEAELSASSPHGLGTDFAGSSGLYVLDSESAASLSFRVPGLHPGYSYEAWSVKNGVATSLGRFGGSAVMMPKEGEMHKHVHETTDHSLQTYELGAAGVDLRGGTLKLTLELIPDDSPEPFGITLFEARVPAAAQIGAQYQIEPSSDPLPAGHATIK